MTSSHIIPELAGVALDELGAAFGGAPAAEPPRQPGEDEKKARRRRKRDAKIRRDAERPPESYERFRILSELVGQGRQVVEIADHKARYAMVVLTVLNAGVFFLVTRAHLIADVPPAVKPWLLGFLIAYAGLSFLFMMYAVDCLRPRRLHYTERLPHVETAPGAVAAHLPRGLLFWEAIADYELEDYRRAWSHIHWEQVNGEIVMIAHGMSRLIRAKYVALGRLFAGLALLILLAGLLLSLLTAVSLMQR